MTVRGMQDRKQSGIGKGLTACLCFLLAILLVAGRVKCYELTLSNEEKRQALLQLRHEKSQLEIQQKRLYTPAYLAETAEKLGMVRPQPEDFFILHIRGAQTP